MTSTEITPPIKRPVAIIIICVIGFIGLLFAVPLILSQAARDVGAWYPAYLAANTAIGAVSFIGLWTMRKWAVYLYTAMGALNQIVLFSMHVWNPLALIIPAIVIIVMFIYVKQMR